MKFSSSKKGIGTIAVIALVIVLAIILFAVTNMFLNSDNSSKNNNAANLGASKTELANAYEAPIVGGIQTVQLTYKDYNYYPQIIKVKVGIPVKIIADTSKVNGCFRSFLIPQMNIKKDFTSSDNAVTFTPDKTGTFAFSCIMNMGQGKIIVV